MQIRSKLTLQFLLLGVVVMTAVSFAIYYSSAAFRHEDFFNRLRSKGRSTANLVFEKSEPDANRVLEIEGNIPVFLQNEKIVIINYLNEVIYTSDENSDLELKNDIIEKVRLGYNVDYRQAPYEVTATLYFSKLDRFVILSAAIDAEGSRHLGKLRNILITVCVLSMFMFFGVGWYVSGKALKPISDVIKRVEEITITSLDLRVDEGNGTDEIGKLARTFNNMLARLETSFVSQKNFIANASHEMRTPLTAIKGQIEVLMMKDRPAEEYKSVIRSVHDDIRSLIDLLNKLLLIARTASENHDIYTKRVSFDDILWQSREEIIRYKPLYEVTLIIDDSINDASQMTVAGDDSLLRTAVTNLIDNACKYSGDHKCEIFLTHAEGFVEARFTDHGIGITAMELEKIFEPFFRGTNTHHAHGTGVGLALVRQIIRNHRGTIRINSEQGKGTTAIITLPSVS